jgi:hypothetical protein
MNNSTEFLNTTVNSLKGNLDKNMNWLDDKSTTNLILLGLVVYTALFVGKVWPKGTDLFKHPLVKIIAFLFVAYLGTKNISLALVATIAIVVIMMTNLKNTKEFLTVVPTQRLDTDDNVYESIMGKCMCRCDGNKCHCNCLDEPENMNISNVMSEEIIPSEEAPIMNERDVIKEMNDLAFENVKKQFLDHYKEKEKEKMVTTYKQGCDKSPYYDETTPFGEPLFLKSAMMAKTMMDADYSGYLE